MREKRVWGWGCWLVRGEEVSERGGERGGLGGRGISWWKREVGDLGV